MKKLKCTALGVLLLLLTTQMVLAQNTSNHGNKFEQLGTELPSPNTYRSVDGAPGPDYSNVRITILNANC